MINGNEVWRKRGGKSSVSFDQNDIDKIQNTIFTHNHPSGSAFSPEDINMMINHGNLKRD